MGITGTLTCQGDHREVVGGRGGVSVNVCRWTKG
jgi:hypothetical protein